MRNKVLIIALACPLLVTACDSKKVAGDKAKPGAENAAQSAEERSARPKDPVIPPPETTQEVMEKMNRQASSGATKAEVDAAADLATQKIIDAATRNASEATKKAMEEAAKSARDAAETINATVPR